MSAYLPAEGQQQAALAFTFTPYRNIPYHLSIVYDSAYNNINVSFDPIVVNF